LVSLLNRLSGDGGDIPLDVDQGNIIFTGIGDLYVLVHKRYIPFIGTLSDHKKLAKNILNFPSVPPPPACPAGREESTSCPCKARELETFETGFLFSQERHTTT
jgi:hypothetical protein